MADKDRYAKPYVFSWQRPAGRTETERQEEARLLLMGMGLIVRAIDGENGLEPLLDIITLKGAAADG